MSSVLSMLTSHETATLPTPKKPVFTQTKMSSDLILETNSQLHLVKDGVFSI
ncbi:hypothetical protein GIB67_001206 [Kingdonia uniflora]|uniref:Uncharacterized protein n=1 Tax=Kingdonia uniflora TaxID=39325 RepID=A0A7J7LGM2_9MAGN|nr:hypothetical protein GIB67_001206 [Kingdonia uniflora]